ncbi:MAG TPA: hypothetical protein VGJ59_13735 [Jatrophihabitantaceae bacterium]
MRGAQNVPGGDPVDTSAVGAVYPGTTSGNSVAVGRSDSAAAVLGDKFWLTLLVDGLH